MSEENEDLPPTAPNDARFANQNVTRYCYVMFLDYVKCTRLLSEGYEPCQYFKKTYQSLCPNAWVDRWYQQIDNGTFPQDLPNDKN